MEDSRIKRGRQLIFVLSGLAILGATVQLVYQNNSLAVYNLGRAIIFALACIYLHKNPTKVNFVGPFKIRDEGNSSDPNVKISYFFSYLFSAINLAISAALYFDP